MVRASDKPRNTQQVVFLKTGLGWFAGVQANEQWRMGQGKRRGGGEFMVVSAIEKENKHM